MLNQRLTAEIKICSIYDSALLDIDTDVARKYVLTRDLDPVLAELPADEKLTIFHVRPLQADKEYLMDGWESSQSETAWTIFRHHVKAADNLRRADGTPVIQLDKDGIVKDEVRELISPDVAKEIAGVICHKANESTRPFMMPDTWLQERIRSLAVRALIAQEKPVKPTDTK